MSNFNYDTEVLPKEFTPPCNECGKPLGDHQFSSDEFGLFCEVCFEELFMICADCGAWVEIGDNSADWENDDTVICAKCRRAET